MNHVMINRQKIYYENEPNVLEVIRKAGIELPTFCYHSELSVYGACRLCLVDIEGKGIQPACSTPPENGMVIQTATEEIRDIRKIIVELLLANGGHDCTTCSKSGSCRLQDLATQLGIKDIRFKKSAPTLHIDDFNPSIVRDPDKCVLCGDCVRMCSEIQSVGAIDFAHRGYKAAVVPSFGKNLDKVECVYCGQCVRICPTGALSIKSTVEPVWKSLDNKKKTVVAQIAPAVRVAINEEFGGKSNADASGKIAAALRRMGFDAVYDTSFAADLTVIEEGREFVRRAVSGESLPLFTSCCPAWVKFAEQYYPELLSHLSSCRSPQQMFGSCAKAMIAKEKEIAPEDIVMVSIMPCTAKKFEAERPEFSREGVRDVDHVITTRELSRMIKEAGIDFNSIAPESFDMPFGFKTGAGVIFGNSGGVSEAVLRFLYAGNNEKADSSDFVEIRSDESIREVSAKIGGKNYSVAVVSGLANARKVIDAVLKKEKHFDIIEVMACPGGCVCGAGQPVYKNSSVKDARKKSLYETERMLQLSCSRDNPYIKAVYEHLKDCGEHGIHDMLHTGYHSRRRIQETDVSARNGGKKVQVDVCVGTGCFLNGSQKILQAVNEYASTDAGESVSVNASFCFERCGSGPVVRINGEFIEGCSADFALSAVKQAQKKAQH